MTDKSITPYARREIAPPPQGLAAIAATQPDPPKDGIGDFLNTMRRHRWLILLVFAVTAAAGAGVTLAQTPKYQATALLKIDPNPDQVVSQKQSLTGSRIDNGMVDSEIEVLKSPALAARLASELSLDADPEWNPRLRKEAARTVDGQLTRSPLGFGAEPATGELAAPETASLIETAERNVPDDVVDALSGAISIHRRGLSNVIEVSAVSQSPAKAAAIANGLSQAYLKSLTEAKHTDADKANQWLKTRVDELGQEVQQKLAAAQAYRAQRNLLTAQGVSLVEQQVAQLQSALLQTQAEYSQKQAEFGELRNYVDHDETVASASGPSSTDAMRDLRAKKAETSQKLADLSQRLGPNHPLLQQARQTEAAIDAQIGDEMGRIAGKAKMDMQVVGARMQTQQRELASLRGQLVNDNFDQVRLNALETDAEGAKSVYEGFLERYHEVAQQGTLSSEGARLLSRARPPSIPSSPHMLLNGSVTAAAALALALIAGLIAEQCRGTVETTEDLEQRVGVRALVAVPLLRRRTMRRLPRRDRNPGNYLLTKRMSPYAEALRVLQASIFLANQTQNKVIALTSAMSGEGKTTLALGLARIAALGGQRVVIIDCDLRMRALNKVLQIQPTEGLQEVLTGQLNWPDAVGCDKPSGAHVLPASDGGVSAKDVFSGGGMEKLIGDLASEYDLVVLDCAPLFAVADTRLIAAMADAVVVVARAGRTPARALAAAISQLEIAGANVLGVALNRVDTTKGRRSFYDGLYYSRAFSGYYAKEA